MKNAPCLLVAALALASGCTDLPIQPPNKTPLPATTPVELQAPAPAPLAVPSPPTTPDPSSVEALFRSIADGDFGEFLRLVNDGVHHFSRNKLGETPLYFAAEKGETEMANLLIAKGADPKALTPNGETVLHAAAMIESSALISALIEAGAEVNTANNDGETPLHWAALTGTFLAVKALADAGADLNVQDAQRGNTPLHAAVPHDDIVLIHSLLSKNVRIDIRNIAGVTALEFAKSRGRASAKLFER